MKMVYQTRLHQPPHQAGNCYAACIATLLGISIDDLPWPNRKEIDSFATYMPRLSERLGALGWHLLRIERKDTPCCPSKIVWSSSNLLDDQDYYLATGKTSRGFAHTVIMRGAGLLVHDPYPGGNGITETLCVEYLVPLRGAYDLKAATRVS